MEFYLRAFKVECMRSRKYSSLEKEKKITL
jgi:hypothetical protein